jgi:amphi-Trp domain-containing protein
MAKELEERDVSQEEAAARLEAIADKVRSGDSMDVNVNNRTIHLSSPAEIAMEVDVRERSTLLRGDREGITITLDWKPSQ